MIKRTSRLANIFLCLLAIVLALSTIEVLLRVMGYGYPIVYEKSALWGYSPAPNQKERRLRNSHVTIDQDGFRSVQPLQTANQIIFFGDSITYGGSYVDDQELFSSLTCEMLNATKPEFTYSCANAAVNAYGVRNMLGRMLYVEKQFPDATMVVTVISGDFSRNFSQLTALPYFSDKPPEPFPATIELIAYAMDSVRDWLRFSSPVKSSAKEPSASAMEEGIVIKLLDEFITRRRLEGKQTLTVWSPSKNWFNGIQHEQEQLPYARLQERGINFIDMTKSLRTSNALVSDLFYDDIHLEREGHRIYAEAIVNALAKQSAGLTQ